MESWCVFYINKLRTLQSRFSLLLSFPLNSFPFFLYIPIPISVCLSCLFFYFTTCQYHKFWTSISWKSLPSYLLIDSLNHWKLNLLHTVLNRSAWNFYQIFLCDYTQRVHSETTVAELNNMCTFNLLFKFTGNM